MTVEGGENGKSPIAAAGTPGGREAGRPGA